MYERDRSIILPIIIIAIISVMYALNANRIESGFSLVHDQVYSQVKSHLGIDLYAMDVMENLYFNNDDSFMK